MNNEGIRYQEFDGAEIKSRYYKGTRIPYITMFGGGQHLSSFYSRDEIEEISEGLIQVYKNQYPSKVISYIDIEHFITAFLGLNIEFATFAEKDLGKIGFTSDGNAELMICQNGRIIPFVFPEKTIIIDKFLLSEKEYGRRRFTMAHEAAHIILNKMEQSNAAYFRRMKAYANRLNKLKN